jgi:hypothetical protein
MSTLKYIANAQLMTVALGAPYTAGSGTMTLAPGTGAFLPTTGDFWIRQANTLVSTAINILKVTARTVDTLTVVGGQDGTTDQNIVVGTPMTWTLCYSALTQLLADIAATSTKVIATYTPADQAASVLATNLATNLATGLYRIDAYIQVISTNATPAFVSINVTHVYNGITKTEKVVDSLNLGTANQEADSTNVVRVDAASTISFTITADAGSYLYSPMLVLSKIG